MQTFQGAYVELSIHTSYAPTQAYIAVSLFIVYLQEDETQLTVEGEELLDEVVLDQPQAPAGRRLVGVREHAPPERLLNSTSFPIS